MGFSVREAAKANTKAKEQEKEEEKKKGFDVRKVSESRKTINFDTLSDDLTAMNATLNGIYGGWQDKDTMTSTRAKVEETYNRLLDYEDYRNNYGDDSFTDLSELMNTYKSALDDWENLAEVYGQYENAEAYTSAVKKAKEKAEADEKLRKEMLSADMDVQNAKTHALEYHLGEVQKLEKNIHKEKVQQNSDGYKSASQELDNYLADIGYSSIEELESAISNQKKFVRDSAVLQDEQKILGSADFAKYSAIGAKIGNPNYEDAQQLNFFGHMYGGTPLGNKLKFAKDHKDKIISDTHSAMTPGGTGIPVSIYYTSANDEEQRIYEYYLGQEREGKAKSGTADKYLDSILPRLKSRYESEQITNIDTFAHEHPVIGSGASVGYSLGSGIEHIADSINYGVTGIMDDNFNARASSTIRSRVSKDYDWNVDLGIIKGDAFDFLYNTTMSGVDSAAAMAIGGSYGGLMLGLSAAASATNDALDRGFTDEQALKQGFMSGAFEMLFESLSIGIFLNEDATKGLLRNLATSMFVNASEETATELANIAYDTFANGDLSNYQVRIQELVDSGKTPEEARRIVSKEFAGQVLEAGASGAVMGGGFTTINTAKYGAYTNSLGKAIRNNENVGNVVDLASVQFSPEEKSAYDAYTRYANKGINAENIKNGKLGNLAHSLGADAQAVLASKDSTPEQKAKAERILQDLDAYTDKNSVSKYGREGVKALYGDEKSIKAYIDEGLESAEGTELRKLAEKFKAKLDKGKKLTTSEITQLVDATRDKVKGDIATTTEARLTELGEEGNVSEIAKIIAKRELGEKLTSAETEMLENSKIERKAVELAEATAGMSKEYADLFIENYNGKDDIEDYADSFELVRYYAEKGVDTDHVLEHKGVLTEAQALDIYKKAPKIQRTEQQKAIDKLVAKHSGKLSYKSVVDDSVIDYDNKGTEGKVNWNSLNSRQRQAITFAKGFAKGLGINLKFVTDGAKRGFNGKFVREENTLYIDVYAGIDQLEDGTWGEESIIPTLAHEITHWAKDKSPVLYAELSDKIFSALKMATGKSEIELIAEKRAELDGKGIKRNDAYARDEIIARACEDMLSMSEEGKKMFNSMSESEQKSFVAKIKELINDIVNWIDELLGSYKSDSREAKLLRDYKEELQDIAKTWDAMLVSAMDANAALEAEGIYTDAERITSNELDVSYSLRYNGDIAKGQLGWFEKNKAHITEAELKEAQKVTGAMVDVMIKHSEILPEDKIGKVLTKNGSYDRSVENTTICVRTLSYNEFVDKVQEEIGRPLTQMESFLVSQKMYDIATDPQCLYCYVSLDRKAFNDMLLRYMTERDTVIAKYNNSDKSPQAISKLYEEFLNGRKDSKDMKPRFNKWLECVDNGTQLLSLADIATEERQSVIKANGGILAEQLADARRYAQNASWAKVQKNYVAYRDEILKLGDRVVKNLNAHYGLRWYSFSDYSAAFIVENMQQITDASLRGLKGLAYTKDTDFVEIFAPTGMNINVSVFVKQDKNGNFFIDEKQSANFKKAVKLRKKYPNVGIVATVPNDEALRWASEQEWSDVVIPFHIVRTGTDVAEYYKWLNYTSESGDTIADKNLWEAYVNSLNLSSENARKKVSKNIYPSEHKNDKDTYLSLCESRGLTPRFVRFAGEEWYMKLVNETRLSADNSLPLKPKFNLGAAKTSFDKFIDKGGYNGGWYKEGTDVDAEVKNVANDVLAGKKANEVDYGRQDDFVPEDLVASRKKNRTHGKTSGEQLSERRITELTKEDDDKLIKHFGKTGNYEVAGYMLKNGVMLDFSGKHWGDTTSRTRQVDHRDVWDVWSNPDRDGTDEMVNMIGNGNIRLMPETGGINLAVAPSKNQRVVLRRYIEWMSRHEGVMVDIDAVGGDTVKSFEYDKGVSVDRVMRDIDNYFKGGNTSDLMRFHTMGDEGIQYSERNGKIKKAEELSETDFRFLLEQAQYGVLDDESYIPMRISTPEFFRDVVYEHSEGKITVMDVPLASEVKHVRQNMEEDDGTSYGESRPHDLSVDDVVLISKEMGHPSYIVFQANKRYAMVVSFYNKERKRVIASIDFAKDTKPENNFKHQQYMNGYNAGYYNIIVTQYQPDSFENYLKECEIIYDKKKMNGKYHSGSGRVVTFTYDTPFIEDSLTHPDAEINEEIVNNEGEQLSERRRPITDIEYLELAKNPNRNDAKLRKIADEEAIKWGCDVDKNGKPVKFYHGTDNFGFTQLDVSVSDDGISFFATDSLEVARTYVGNKTKTDADVRRIGKKGDENTTELRNAEIKEHEKTLKKLLVDRDDMIKFINKKLRLKTTEDLYDISGIVAEAIDRIENGMSYNEAFFGDGDFVFTKKPWSTFDDAFDAFAVRYAKRKHRRTIPIEEYRDTEEYNDLYGEWLFYEGKLSSALSQLGAITENKGIYAMYGKTGDFLEIDAGGSEWNDILVPGAKELSTREVAELAKEQGYAGVKISNLIDDGGRGKKRQTKPATVYIFFNPSEQMKSADTVTYDDNGNVIPISQRFTEKDDIRFSEKDTGTSAYDIMGEKKALEKRYNKLAADFANYKERVKLDKTLTKGKVIDPKQLEAVARYLVKFADSDYKASELAKMLNDLYVDIQDGARDDSMSWDEMYSKAYEVAKEIRSEAKIKIERPAYYDMILKDIRSARIAPNDGQKGDAKHRFGEHYVGKFRGRVTIANDGTPLDIKWSEWASKYPSVFDKDIGDAQQLVELYDIYDDLRNAGDVVQEYEESEVLQSLATEIINKAWTVTKFESTADKNAKAIKEMSAENERRIKELDAQHRKDIEELRASFGAEIESLNRQALNEHEGFKQRLREKDKAIADAKLLEQMYYGKELLKKDKKIAEQRLADDIHYGKILNDLRTKRQVDVDRAKAAGRERLAQYRENVERNGVVKRITTNSLKLTKMLADNSKDSHVPETLKGAVKELLEAIDASSKQWLETGVPTKQDISLNKAFSRLNTVVAKGSQELGDVLEEMYGSGIDESLMEFVEQIDNGTVYFLNEMSIDDLNKLDKIVRIIKSSVNKVNMYHTVLSGLSARQHGIDTIKDLDKRTKVYADGKHHFDQLKTKTYWNNLNPYYAFKNLGGSAQEMFRAFQDGQDKIAFLAKEVIDFADGLYTAKEYKKWSDTYFDFSIPQPSGKVSKFSMNVPQIMSLYCVIKQEDARNHILHGDENGEGGGITIAETKDKKAVRRNIRITEADLENILSKLDDKRVGKAKGGTAMAVADKLQEYMGTRGAELGNEITMARWGIKSFGIENYFPIKVSEGAVPSKGETPGVDSMRMLELLNASFTHSRNHMSKKSVEIGDVFDVFSSHMSDMIRYNALALPILDMYKWINYKGVSEAGEEFSLQTSVKEAFGDYAWGYLQTFLKDVSGSSKSDTRDNLAVRFFKNSKIAKVAGNIRVTVLQFTSFIRAGAVMDNKYLLHALHHKPKIAKSEEKCGIVLWKSLGYYDTDITRGLTDKIKHDESVKDKVVGWSLKGAEVADKVTMGVLWNACELEIRDTRKDLKVGSPEFNEAVALRLREVIYRTQVVDSILTRSQMMRSPSGWDKMLTTFGSESTLSFNLMTDIFVSTQLETRETNFKEAMRKNGKYVRKAITAYVVTNVVTTLVQAMFDAFRDYDEDEKDEAYWARLMLENFAVNSSMVAKIPYLNLFVSALQGFTSSRADTDWMYSTINAGKQIYKLMSGSGDVEKLLKYVIKAGSDVTGIAAYNVYRDIMAFYMFLAGNS